jgi:hypothetical protein
MKDLTHIILEDDGEISLLKLANAKQIATQTWQIIHICDYNYFATNPQLHIALSHDCHF